MKLITIAAAISALYSCPAVFAECAHRTEMKDYTICFPKAWSVYIDPSLDRVSGCNKSSGKCTGPGGGFPVAGAVFIFLMPAEKVPDHPPYHSPADIVSLAPHAGMPAPDISVVKLDKLSSGSEGKCLVARSLLFGKVWDEVYGLEVNGTLFRAWVQYNSEPEKIEGYRNSVIETLSSLSLR